MACERIAYEKVEAFAVHVLQECEQEGFTISEAHYLITALQQTIRGRIEEMHREIKISAGAQGHGGPAGNGSVETNWTADVVARMHMAGISIKQLAAEAGYTPEYVSMILHGHRDTSVARAAILDALDRLTESAGPETTDD